MRMVIISWSWSLFKSRFLIIWRMSYLEKWQLVNEFSVSRVNCGGNTLLLQKKVKDFTLFFEINKALVKNFAFVNWILLATFWNQMNTLAWLLSLQKGQSARIYRPGFKDKNDHVISWNKDLLSHFFTF